MDFQLFLGMWDDRWVWGTRLPNRPSYLWLALAFPYFAVPVSFSLILILDSSLVVSNACYYYATLSILSGILMTCLSLTQYKIESKQLIGSPQIDEIKLRINHYFKMKEAIFSRLGFTVLILSLVRIPFALMVFEFNFAYNEKSFLVLLSLLDLICFANVILLLSLFVTVKIFISYMSDNHPKTLMRVRQSICGVYDSSTALFD